MNPSKCIILSAILMTALSTLGSWHTAIADEGSFLADRHKKNGVACGACHKEAPPNHPVPMAVCLGCHGGYETVAQANAAVDPNPHDSHEGALECSSCHHAHKASENYCSKCHSFEGALAS